MLLSLITDVSQIWPMWESHFISLTLMSVGAKLGPTHTNAHNRAASDGTDAAPMLKAVRPVRMAGQTGSPAKNSEVRRTLAPEGPRQGKRT